MGRDLGTVLVFIAILVGFICIIGVPIYLYRSSLSNAGQVTPVVHETTAFHLDTAMNADSRSVVKFEVNGHSYFEFRIAHEPYAVIHDPDCSCLKNLPTERP